jgi:hypothetical protein
MMASTTKMTIKIPMGEIYPHHRGIARFRGERLRAPFDAISPAMERRSVIGQTGTATDPSFGSALRRSGIGRGPVVVRPPVSCAFSEPVGQSAGPSVRVEHDAVHGVCPPTCRYAHLLEWMFAQVSGRAFAALAGRVPVIKFVS